MITRRDFVGRAALLSAGAAALPRLLDPFRATGPGAAGAGPARAAARGDEFSLANDDVAAAWSTAGGALRAVRLEDRRNRTTLTPSPDVFRLDLEGGAAIRSSAMRLAGPPRVERLAGDPAASRLVERAGGQQVTVALADPASPLRVTWRAILRDGSAYLRQEIVLETTGADVPLRRITLVDQRLPGTAVVGAVTGTPLVAGHIFAGFEHPLAGAAADGGRARAWLDRELPLRPGTTLTCSSVFGVTSPGQLRRDFLTYLERERAHPYRPFLHYNSWYDIGYFTPLRPRPPRSTSSTPSAHELQVKRGVTLDSFLFDDGWDDHSGSCGTSMHGFPRRLRRR